MWVHSLFVKNISISSYSVLSNSSNSHSSFKYKYSFPQTQLNIKTVLFQIIQFSVIIVSMSKTVLFQVIHFSISMHFSSTGNIDRILSYANTPGQSRTGNDGNEGVICIPQSSGIIGVSSSDFFSIISRNPLPTKDAVGVFHSPTQLGILPAKFRLLSFE